MVRENIAAAAEIKIFSNIVNTVWNLDWTNNETNNLPSLSRTQCRKTSMSGMIEREKSRNHLFASSQL